MIALIDTDKMAAISKAKFQERHALLAEIALSMRVAAVLRLVIIVAAGAVAQLRLPVRILRKIVAACIHQSDE